MLLILHLELWATSSGSHVQHVVATRTWRQSSSMSDRDGINIGMGMKAVLPLTLYLSLCVRLSACACACACACGVISSMLMNGVCRVIIMFFIAVIIMCLADIYSPFISLSDCQLHVASWIIFWLSFFFFFFDPTDRATVWLAELSLFLLRYESALTGQDTNSNLNSRLAC